ncbi:B12-binding domain-containing protein [Bacteroidota bacterium]
MTNIVEEIKTAVLEGEDDLAQSLVRQALNDGLPPIEVVNRGIVPGIQAAGELWQQNKYFHTDMIMSATAFRTAMEVVEPLISEVEAGGLGKFLIGAVAGDMHDLGKMMVVAMLRGAGFQVVDLGEDVPRELFLDKVIELEPNILGLGCYMTTTMPELEAVIKSLEEQGLRQRVKVMIGGVPTTQEYANQIRADAWGKDALDAIIKAKKLMGPE